jgi:hypothetical protein
MPFSLWFRIFEFEFKRRTGISWTDACGEMDIPRNYYDRRITPTNAVLAEMEDMDLEDVTASRWVRFG